MYVAGRPPVPVAIRVALCLSKCGALTQRLVGGALHSRAGPARAGCLLGAGAAAGVELLVLSSAAGVVVEVTRGDRCLLLDTRSSAPGASILRESRSGTTEEQQGGVTGRNREKTGNNPLHVCGTVPYYSYTVHVALQHMLLLARDPN